jgi:hypothetical protein
MSQPRNYLIEYPAELLGHHVVPYLNPRELMLPISLSWFGRAPFMWKKVAQTELGISIELLNQFEADVFAARNMRVNYQRIVKNLHGIKKISHRLPAHLRYCYRDPRYHLQLLTCCLNDEAYAARTLPIFENQLWVELALFGDLDQIYKLSRLVELEYQEDYFATALDAGNLNAAREMYHYLQLQNDEFELTKTHLDLAAGSGNVALVKWVQAINANLKEDRETFLEAVGSGKVEMIKLFSEAMRSDVDLVLQCVVCGSGDEESIRWFCETFQFPLCAEAVGFVFESGNALLAIKLMKELNMEFKNDFFPSVVRAGNVTSFKHFLNEFAAVFMSTKDEYRRKATQDNPEGEEARLILDNFYSWLTLVGQSGNVEIIRYCHEELGLPMTEAILENVIATGDILSFEYVREHLVVDEETARAGVLEFDDEVISDCPNFILRCQLAISKKMREVGFGTLALGESLDYGLPVHFLPFAIFGLFDMLLNPTWQKMNDQRVGLLISLFERELPPRQSIMIEQHALKALLQKTAGTSLIKAKAAYQARIENLTALFDKKTDSFDNTFLLTIPAAAPRS